MEVSFRNDGVADTSEISDAQFSIVIWYVIKNQPPLKNFP